jgi:ketol-acid reductoisomerase
VAAWETLVDRGHSPETAYFECVHEVKIIVDLLYADGIEGMREKISTTAAYGGLRAGRRVIGDASRQAMQELLDDIESGRFARAFEDDQRDGGAALRGAIDREATHPIVGTGQALRGFLQRCRLDSSSEPESD